MTNQKTIPVPKQELTVVSKGKDGWKRKHVTIEDPSTRRTYEPMSDYSLRDDIDDIWDGEYQDEYTPLDNIQEGIPIGTADNYIDELSNFQRMLYQENDRFFMTANMTLRKKDGIEQAFEDNQWGENTDEIDDEEALASKDNALDAAHNEQQELREAILSHFEEQIAEAVKDEQEELVVALQDQCEAQLKGLKGDKELAREVESQFIGSYHIPKEHVSSVNKRTHYKEMSLAANKREKTFERMLFRMSRCQTREEIYGNPTGEFDDNEREIYKGGLLEEVRKMYSADKEIWAAWTNDIKEANRNNLIDEYREKCNNGERGYDEESLRIRLYYEYDRERKFSPNICKLDKAGKIVLLEAKQMTKSSNWDNKRQKAYMHLNMTHSQWNSFYHMRDIIVRRIYLNRHTSNAKSVTKDKGREAAMDIIRKDLDKALFSENPLEALIQHVKRMKYREFFSSSQIEVYQDKIIKEDEAPTFVDQEVRTAKSGYNFKPSVIDYISINDEKRWNRTVNKAQKFLKSFEKKEEDNTNE